jgi:hypothetical protein
VTADITQGEEATTKLLEGELDKSMQKFQAKNADFFGEYTNARMIIDLGERHEKNPRRRIRKRAARGKIKCAC